MAAAEAPSVRPRIVTIVGWVWLVLGGLRGLDGLLSLIVWKIGGVDRLSFVRFQSESVQIRVADMEAVIEHAVPILLAQVVIAGAVAWAAFELLRMKSWARRAIQGASGLGILATLGVAAYVYAAAARTAGFEGLDADKLRIAGVAAASVIALIGSSFFGITLWALGRPAVGRAFEKTP